MIEQFDLQGLVDIGFVVFVTFICAKSLFKDTHGTEARSQRWQTELKLLEQTLKELIAEAGAASTSLDRSLLQRKRELENLLKKIEDKDIAELLPQTASSLNHDSRGHDSREIAPRVDAKDVPNETWLEPHSPNHREAAAVEQHSSPKEQPSLDTGLNQLVEAADDTISLSSQLMHQASDAKSSSKKSLKKGLAEAIELIREADAEDKIEQATFEKTSIMDRSTYRIARRLLKEGKELHIVSRKLDLPVSEVRLLDRLMRGEGTGDEMPLLRDGNVGQPKTEKPQIEAKGNVDLDVDIERELALL